MISPQLQPQHRPAGHVRLDFVRHVALMRLGGGGGVDGGGFGAGSVNGGLCCGGGLWKTCASGSRCRRLGDGGGGNVHLDCGCDSGLMIDSVMSMGPPKVQWRVGPV